MTLSVYKSLLLSISTQVVTGIIEVIALLVKVPAKFLFLKQMLVLEVIVQFIEGSFYVYWFRNFKKIVNITPQRYLDWVVTTPTMLITLMFYLIYLKHKQDNTSDQLQFFDLFKKEFNTIITVLSLNWLMLLFGYLGEVKLIPVLLGVALGFIPFFIYYYIIYKKYALLSDEGLKIFYYFLIVWSAYGIVATLSYKIKNTLYNILDLFSKNFFGIFLTYLLFINMKS
jgi:hypothetical protein